MNHTYLNPPLRVYTHDMTNDISSDWRENDQGAAQGTSRQPPVDVLEDG